MAELDAFDPTHALDGWRPPAPASLQGLELGGLLHAGSGDNEIPLIGGEPDRFDPTHLLDGWHPPEPAPLDLELSSLQHVGSSPDEAKLARLKARGYEMLDVEDIELPDLPAPAPRLVFDAWPEEVPAAPPAEEMFEAPPPAVVEAPQLDVHALAPRAEPDPRLARDWQPLAWTALARRMAGASTEVLQAPDGLHVENHAPQWLCALWPPQAAQPALLGRWPEMAALVGAEKKEDALQALLNELPAEAALWTTELDADWGLVAELVLHQDDRLRPAQARALRELAEAERMASLARLNAGYRPQGRVARRRP